MRLREAGFRARAAGRRRCRALRPMRHRFVESIIHEAFPFLALARPPIRPVTPPSSPAPRIAWPDPARADAFHEWLARVGAEHAVRAASLRPASSDASFRRYFRADLEGGGSVIVMDAPPAQENVRPFIHVAGLISAAGLHAPRVLEADMRAMAFSSSTTSAASSTCKRCRRRRKAATCAAPTG